MDPFRSTPNGMGEATAPMPNTVNPDPDRREKMDTGSIARDGYTTLDRADSYGERRGLTGPSYGVVRF